MALGRGALGDVAVSPGFWSGRRVLVTGHTGFKGSWLALWLQDLGAEVVGLSRGLPTSPALFEVARVGDGMVSVDADVRDAEAVRAAVAEHRPEVVFHLAAQPIVRVAYEDPVGTYATNVMGTVNVLEAVRLAGGVRAVVNVTTDKVYEDRGGARGYREDDALGGFDPYASSKACSELVTASYRASLLGGDDAPGVATARAGNVIGGGDWARDRLVPDLVRGALAGETVRIREPRAVRPWQHVLAPLHGYLLLAERLAQGTGAAPALNFGPDPADERPVGEVADRLAQLWGPGLTWASDEGEHPHETAVLRLDSSLAREQLGWRPRWGLEEALASIVAFARAHRDGAHLRALMAEQIAAYAG